MYSVLKENYIDIPNELWEVGHKDPNNPDNSEKNLVYQPPIQGKSRDGYKYDDLGILKYPTSQELERKFDKYYSIEEQKKIYEFLSKKFN